MNIIKDELDPHYALEISESKSKMLRFNMTRDQLSETFNFLSYLIPGLYGWHRINSKWLFLFINYYNELQNSL